MANSCTPGISFRATGAPRPGHYTLEMLSSRLQPGCAETSIIDGIIDMMAPVVCRKYSLHRPQPLVIPIQHFFDQLVARDVVAGFVHDALLLLRAQQVEERNLGLVHGEKEVVVAIEK